MTSSKNEGKNLTAGGNFSGRRESSRWGIEYDGKEEEGRRGAGFELSIL